MILKSFFAILVAILLLPSSQASKNLLQNGDFSKWKNGAPVGWGLYSRKTLKDGEFSRKILDHRSGKSAVKYKDATQAHSLNKIVNVKGGELYELSCKAKLQLAPWYFAIAVQWRDKNYKTTGKYNWTSSSGSDTEFKTLTLKNLVAPANAVKARIILYPYACNQKGQIIKGTILVKDVSFIRKQKETIKKPYKTITAIPLLKKAKITIDGKANDADWKKAVVLSNFTVPKFHITAQEQTQAKVLADTNNLYIFARMYGSKAEELKQTVRSPRDKMQCNGDTLELFFKPFKKSKEQYHILIDSAGSILDIEETWRIVPNVHGALIEYNKNWNPKLESSVQINDNSWTVEIKIPLKEMKVKDSLISQKWLANIARANYKNQKLSSWSVLPTKRFQKSQNWGLWTFMKNIPAVGKFMIVPDTKKTTFAMSMNNPYPSATDIKVRIDTLSNNRIIQQGRIIEQLASNTLDKVINTTIEPSKQLYWVSVWAGKQLLYRNGLKPYSKFITISHYDPKKVVGNKLYLASDMGSFKSFGISTNFKTDIGKNFVSRKKTDVDIVVELPLGIEATYLDIVAWSGIRLKPTSAKKGKKIIRNGIEYTRYIFEPIAFLTVLEQNAIIFFKSNWKFGVTGKAYIYARWKGGVQPINEYDIEVIKIGRMTPFKRTPSRLDYLPAEFVHMWLVNPAKTLKRIGINNIPIPLYPEKQRYLYTSENRKKLYDDFVPKLKANSYYLMSQSDVDPPWWTWTQGKNPDINSRAINIDSKPIKNQYGAITFCTLYRGKYYQKWINNIINSTAFKKYGVTWAITDFEFWPHEMLEDGCYCERCLKTFKPWCKNNNYKDINTSPKMFMEKKSANSKAVEAWTRFSEWRFRKIYLDIKQKIGNSLKNKKIWSGPKQKFLLSGWGYPVKYLIGAVDYFDCNLYYAPSICNKRLKLSLKSFNGDFSSLVAACAPTPMWDRAADVHPSDNLYVIFEVVVAKTQGFEWYPYWSFDMLNLKVMVDGYRTIVPFENIYLDGKVIISVPCSGSKSSARAVKLGNEMLLLVRDYDIKGTEKATVTIPGNGDVEIFDTHSGKKLGTMSSKNRKLTLELGRKRKACLLYVGPIGGYQKRILDSNGKRL